MKRKRIGKKQRELLTRLELLGPIDLVDLDQNGKRGAQSLVRQGLADLGTYDEGEGVDGYLEPHFIKLAD